MEAAVCLRQADVIPYHLMLQPIQKLCYFVLIVFYQFDLIQMKPPKRIHITEQNGENVSFKRTKFVVFLNISYIL